MLSALELLRHKSSTPNKVAGPSKLETPLTPITPDRYRRHTRRRSKTDGLDVIDVFVQPYSAESSSIERSSPHRSVLYDGMEVGTPRRSERIKNQVILPPTPESLPRTAIDAQDSDSVNATRRQGKRGRSRRIPELVLDSPSKKRKRARVKTRDHVGETTIGITEDGGIEPLTKIHLIQERLRYEPWKMLVAVTLLNKTSGRAANPIREEIFNRWPSPQSLATSSLTELAEVLYPLGLFNQRANSLKRLSEQYIQLKWPFSPLPKQGQTTRIAKGQVLDEVLPDKLDVKVFYGAGIYASDSFRIYSPLFPGRGGPEKEDKWIEKRQRAIDRRSTKVSNRGEVDGLELEHIGDYMSSEDDDDEEEEEEWRKVRPTDKELRRYLIWRWGIEGITYDIHKGPLLNRKRDRRRFSYLLNPETPPSP